MSTTPNERLELLITRFLDREAGLSERRELRSLLRRDARAAALFEDLAALDREISRAMHRALRRRPLGPSPLWIRTAQSVGLAAAACIGAFAWLSAPSGQRGGGNAPQFGAPTQASAWFAPPTLGDSYDAAYVDPALPQRASRPANGKWIVVPSDRPGEFLIIEVQRPRLRTQPARGDF